jgi:uncharacterized protein (TIGR03437 family)
VETPLPLLYVSPLQINAVLPYGISPGPYMIRVDTNSVSSNVVSISLAAFSPGIFTVNPNGQGAGIFVKLDGSIVSATNPASRGDVVSFFATGLGSVDPPVSAGDPAASAEPLNRTVQAPRVFFDQFEAQVLYSGLAPGYAGVYQLNVRIPTGVSRASNVPVTLTIGGIASNSVTVALQ